MDNQYAWEEYYVSMSRDDNEITKVKKPKNEELTQAQVKANEDYAVAWWNRQTEERRIQLADEEHWSTPEVLSPYQIRQIFCANSMAKGHKQNN